MKKISIASGKGGTGKTSLAVAMFLANAERSRLLDCDVEEPNCHLFLKAQNSVRFSVELPIPQIDMDKCRLCGKCVRACQFNALALAGKAGVLVFEELCHSCGGCVRACPHGAITEIMHPIGEVSQGIVEQGGELVTGTLAIGHASAPSVIRAVKKAEPLKRDSHSTKEIEYTLVDSPPGTACTFVAAVDGSDFVILVTEATPFGLHDLTLAIEALQNMKLPFGVVVNRSREGANLVNDYCKQKGYRILLEIPESRLVAETYAQGGTLLDAMPEYLDVLRNLLENCYEG